MRTCWEWSRVTFRKIYNERLGSCKRLPFFVQERKVKMTSIHVIEFDEELYKKNLEDNDFPKDTELDGLSKEDIEELKKEGLM